MSKVISFEMIENDNKVRVLRLKNEGKIIEIKEENKKLNQLPANVIFKINLLIQNPEILLLKLG